MSKNRFISKIFIIFLIACLNVRLFAADTTPKDYSEDEFPQGLQDLRRFEIITLGAMPFVTLDTNLAYQLFRSGSHNWSSDYTPNFLSASNLSSKEQIGVVLTSLGICIGIGLTDYIINVIKRSSKQRELEQQQQNIVLTPLNLDDAVKLPIPEVNADEEVKDIIEKQSLETEQEKSEADLSAMTEQSEAGEK